MKGMFSINLENPHKKLTTGDKNKKIRKKKSGPDKKEKYHLRTQTSLPSESEIHETVPDTIAIRQYRQQLNFAKSFISQMVEQHEFRNQDIQEQRDSLAKQLNFPTISIDRLFDHKETNIFNDNFTSCDIQDYLKLVNNELNPKHKKVILNFQGNSFLLTENTNRLQDTEEFKGRFISLLEREVYQNRQNFMEKIKQNQSRYQHCKSQLSEISQELLFLSKIYMDNSSRIKKLANQLALKMSNYFPQPKFQSQRLYFEVIMKKNIAYAVKEHQIDFLNYFRQKEHEERNSLESVSLIDNENEFLVYLKSKKPKKGKPAKYGLHTACSCCFSNYFEPYNPLIHCENCNLRCHKLCYNLKQKSCGNCSYQRLLKTQKQVIPNCIICRQKGQMAIKLRDKVYAHAFCLIVHDQWKIEGRKCIMQQKKKQLQKDFETYSNKNSYFPFKPNLSSNCNDQKFQLIYLESNNYLGFRETIDEQHKEFFEIFNQSMESEGDKIDCKNKCSGNSHCKICSELFYQKFFVTCTQCHQASHAYCAFFEGLDFKIVSTKIQEGNNRINILFDCCSKSVSEKEKLKKSREFVLNRNRFLFENL